MNKLKTSLVLACTLAVASAVFSAHGALTTLYYNHYEKPSDVPTGFYAGGAATSIEDMEAGGLRFGITADAGGIIEPRWIPGIDSVPTDGNPSDPLGARGHSWLGPGRVTFTFDVPHTAAGLVWTDGDGQTFAEFFRGGTSLGIIGPLNLADGSNSGTIEEDTFFGATDPLGITSIRVWNTAGGIEVDHVQFGDMAPVPEPSTYIAGALLFLPFGAHLVRRLRG
jgi:hypothetical protein